MIKHVPQIITIFLDSDGQVRPAPTRLGVCVGIWWADVSTIVAMLQDAAEVVEVEPLIDSDLEHYRKWPYVCHHFGRTEAHNYYDVPRGRVLLNRKTGRGVIYHGNATGRATQRRIAKLYGLTKWDGHIDGHYLMGAAADELFDNEFE
jgi:hypothetical protein